MFLTVNNVIESVQRRSLEYISLAKGYNFNATTILVGCIALYLTYTLIYGLFLCPTRHLPGPFITRFSYIPYYILVFGGKGGENTCALHQKYGPSHILTRF